MSAGGGGRGVPPRSPSPAETRTLYAFAPGGSDPHAVVLTITTEERSLLSDGWAVVHDQATGSAWRIRRADCGGACRCAAEAEQVGPSRGPTSVA